MAKAERPGTMIYFELIEAMSVLTDADKGRLFEGILRYARDGETPNFTGVLAAIWALTKPSIDRDAGRYKEKSLQGRWKVYVREEKKNGREPLDFEAWKHHLITDDNKCYPTATASSTPSSTPTSTSAGAPTSTEALPLTHFSAPSLEQVETYCKSHGYIVDAKKFYLHYKSLGWKKNGAQIQSWEAVLDSWEGQDRQKQPPSIVDSRPDAGELERMKKMRERLKSGEI